MLLDHDDTDFTLISTELLGQLISTEPSACAAPLLPLLRNRYFGLRHGQSEANLEGIISSDPAVGTVKHGLTPLGRLQARRVGTRLVDLVGRDALRTLYFYSSDFTRARQTAEETLSAINNIVDFEARLAEDLDLPAEEREAIPTEAKLLPGLSAGVRITPLLRERFFGEFDATTLLNYNQVWPRDLVSAAHTEFGVESVNNVAARVREFVIRMEEEHEGDCIVLVSHADTLQIAQTYVAGADPRTFSQYRFVNAEVRELLQNVASLPAPVPLKYSASEGSWARMKK